MSIKAIADVFGTTHVRSVSNALHDVKRMLTNAGGIKSEVEKVMYITKCPLLMLNETPRHTRGVSSCLLIVIYLALRFANANPSKPIPSKDRMDGSGTVADSVQIE